MDPFGKEFLLAFFPLLVAIDAIGTVPILLGILETASPQQRRKAINIALLTALAVGLSFLFLGHALLRFLDIEVGHFAIAGGIILLAIALGELVGSGFLKQQPPDVRELAAIVPIGTPLTAGPGTLATLLVLTDQYSYGVVVAAFIVNIAIAWVIFTFGSSIARVLGKGGLRASSKIAALLLAAIAVRLAVTGIKDTFAI
jgi:multiple antibiotic resistance protein